MKASKTIYSVLIALVLCSLISHKAEAQDFDLDPGVKLWSPITLGFRFTDKFSASTNLTPAFKFAPFRLNFFASGLTLSYRINKSWGTSLAYSGTLFPTGNEGHTWFNKVQARVDYRHKFFNFKAKHSLRYEWYTPITRKFKSRIRYGFKVYFLNKILPLSMRPEITNEFYYFLGGVPLTYRDTEGNILAFQSPNGLHRYRLTIGLRIRAAKRLYFTLNFRRQWEFNTGLFPNREIAVPQVQQFGA